MLSSKATGCRCEWYDPVMDVDHVRSLKPSDPALWIRFAMSFLINGVGFHILVHALPIQVAGQSSLTGIVFRAVGMLYLVDLDDAPGTALTLVEGDEDTTATTPDVSENKMSVADPAKAVVAEVDTKVVRKSAQELIDDAKAQMQAVSRKLEQDLDALAEGVDAGSPTSSDDA